MTKKKAIELKSKHKRTTETVRETWKINNSTDSEVIETVNNWLSDNLKDNCDLTIVITSDVVEESHDY